MQVFLDHLTAIIVGTVVLVLLLSFQGRRGQAEVEGVQRASQRAIGGALALTLEEDLLNVGAGLTPGQAAITTWNDSTLAFRRKTDFGTAAARTITYRRRRTGTARERGRSVPLYTLERYVDGTRVLTTPGTFTSAVLAMRDRAGAAVTNPSAAAAIHVRFDLAVGADGERTRFERTFYPPALLRATGT